MGSIPTSGTFVYYTSFWVLFKELVVGLCENGQSAFAQPSSWLLAKTQVCPLALTEGTADHGAAFPAVPPVRLCFC